MKKFRVIHTPHAFDIFSKKVNRAYIINVAMSPICVCIVVISKPNDINIGQVSNGYNILLK